MLKKLFKLSQNLKILFYLEKHDVIKKLITTKQKLKLLLIKKIKYFIQAETEYPFHIKKITKMYIKLYGYTHYQKI